MAANTKELVARLRFETDQAASRRTQGEIKSLDKTVQDLGDSAERGRDLLERIRNLPPPTDTADRKTRELSERAVDRLSQVGDALGTFEMTLDDLGIELGGVGNRVLEAGQLLSTFAADPLGAVIQATGLAIKSAMELAETMEQGTQQVDDAWDKLLSGEFGSAAEVAAEYEAAQQRINQAHDEGGVIADLVAPKWKVISADQKDLQRTLTQTATDYRTDYVPAVQSLNASLQEGERVTVLMTEAEFNLAKKRRDSFDAIGQYIADAAKEVAAAAVELVEAEKTMRELAPEFDQFQQDLAQAEDDYKDQLLSIQAQYENDLSQIIGQANQQRQDLMENFIAQSEAAETDYYRQRSEIAAEAGIDAARAEEDHQRDMQRMRADASVREQDLLGMRDALGLKKERARNERERREADQDFDTQKRRTQEDLARQMDQMRISFEEQQAERQADYDQQLRDLEESAKKEQDELEKALRKEEATLERAHQIEQLELEASFAKRRQSLGIFLSGEERQIKQHQDFMASRLETWIQRMNRAANALAPLGTQAQPGGEFQRGGYMPPGLHQVSEAGSEFAMTAGTTRAAEKLLGAGLSQDRILAAMAGGGGQSITLSAPITITGVSGPEDTARAVQVEIWKALDELVSKIR